MKKDVNQKAKIFVHKTKIQNIKRFKSYLSIDSINLSILIFKFRSHIKCHVSQITNHCIDLTHIILHFILTCIISNSKTINYNIKSIKSVILHLQTFQCSRLVDQDHYDHHKHAEVDC